MAGNDIDYIIHVIYEKFTENQKNKKQADRVYMSEDEFTQDLKEFVKNSKIEDKNLLVYEIYRNVSKDALEISSDGKIIVSPKVLNRVEREILDKKEQKRRLTGKNNGLVNEDQKEHLAMERISSEEFKKLSFEQRVERVSQVIENFAEKNGFIYDQDDIESLVELGEEDFSATLSNEANARENQILEWLKGENNPVLMEFGGVIYDSRKKLLESWPCNDLFIIDGKFDVNLFTQVIDALGNDNTLNVNEIYLKVWKQCGYEEDKAKSILEKIEEKSMNFGELKAYMALLVDLQAQKKELENYADIFKDLSPEEREKTEEQIYAAIKILKLESENSDSVNLEKTASEFNKQRNAIKPKNLSKAINARKEVKKANNIAFSRARGEERHEELTEAGKPIFEKLEGQRNGSIKKLVIKNNKVRTIDGFFKQSKPKIITLKGKTPLDLRTERKVYTDSPAINGVGTNISDFELGTLFNKAEEIQFEKLAIERDKNTLHAERIEVEQAEKKVVPQVEVQSIETNDNGEENNLPKELTWVDRAKQGLFKFGKKISNVVNAVTSRNIAKGLLERIADVMHSDNDSTSDITSDSGTTSVTGSSVSEKTVEAPIDYLNTQFKVDVELAVQNAKATAENDAKKKDSLTEVTQDEER